jgi:hypothetical protein
MQDEVAKLIRDQKIEEILTSPETIQILLDDATLHIASAQTLLVSADLRGAFQIAYDSMRKSCVAIMNHFGYRATNRGGHFAVFVCAGKLLDSIGEELDGLQETRRVRNAMEYPGDTRLFLNSDDVTDVIDLAVRVRRIARTVITFED